MLLKALVQSIYIEGRLMNGSACGFAENRSDRWGCVLGLSLEGRMEKFGFIAEGENMML